AQRPKLGYQSALPGNPLGRGYDLKAEGRRPAQVDAGVVAVQVLQQPGLDVLRLADVDPLARRKDPIHSGGSRRVLPHGGKVEQNPPGIFPGHGGLAALRLKGYPPAAGGQSGEPPKPGQENSRWHRLTSAAARESFVWPTPSRPAAPSKPPRRRRPYS